MSGKSYKQVQCTLAIADAVCDAYSELQSLRDECQEIVDNAPEGLNQTQRIQTFEEAVDYLDDCDNEPQVPKCIGQREARRADRRV